MNDDLTEEWRVAAMPDPVEPEPVFLVCLPTRGEPRAPVPGSSKRMCCHCRQQVWIAPTGMQVQRERSAMILCMLCWRMEMDPELDKAYHALTLAQQREVDAWVRAQK